MVERILTTKFNMVTFGQIRSNLYGTFLSPIPYHRYMISCSFLCFHDHNYFHCQVPVLYEEAIPLYHFNFDISNIFFENGSSINAILTSFREYKNKVENT